MQSTTWTLAALLPTFFSSILIAQDPGTGQDPAPKAEAANSVEIGLGQMVEDPSDAAHKALQENDIKIGWDPEAKLFAAVGVGSYMLSTAESRNAGFSQAMQDARSQLANFLALEIESSVKSAYEEPGSNPSLSDFGADRIKAAIDAEAASVEELKALLLTDTFKSSCKTVAVQEIGALQAFQTFENFNSESGGKVAVAVTMSPNTRAMQAAMLGRGSMPKGIPQAPIGSWLAEVEREGRLAYTHGVVMRTNEQGEVCLLSWGYASPVSELGRAVDAAKNKAFRGALDNLRQFAGMLVASTAAMENSYSLKQFSDMSVDYTDANKYQQSIDALSKVLSLPGCSLNVSRTVSLPGIKSKVVVAVAEWKLSNTLAANELRTLLDGLRGSVGGAGASGLLPPPAPKKPAAGIPAQGGSKPENKPLPPKPGAKGEKG